MLCGLVRRAAGDHCRAGRVEARHGVRTKFGYVAQRFSLYRDLTVEENIRFFAGACRVPRRGNDGRITRLLAVTDSKGKRSAPAGSFSGGMRQLLALACALVHEPPLLFLDEPTSGLDPVHRQQMWNLLYDLSHRGITIFVTTHYMDEAERCTEVGFIDQGRLLAKASPRAFKASFSTKLLEIEVEPVMEALVRSVTNRKFSGSLCERQPADLRRGTRKSWCRWKKQWPFPELRWLGHRWVEPDMEDVFTAYSQGYEQF